MQPATSEQGYAATARRVIEDVYTGELDAIEELVAPDFVNHHPDAPYETRGRDGFRERIRRYAAAFPDLSTTVHDCIAQGERVAIRYSATGTNTGATDAAEATGKRIAVEAQAILRFGDGQLAEMWDAWDVLGLTEQLSRDA
jgi:steroid delta-isomerase-like uncharacterized protein